MHRGYTTTISITLTDLHELLSDYHRLAEQVTELQERLDEMLVERREHEEARDDEVNVLLAEARTRSEEISKLVAELSIYDNVICPTCRSNYHKAMKEG